MNAAVIPWSRQCLLWYDFHSSMYCIVQICNLAFYHSWLFETKSAPEPATVCKNVGWPLKSLCINHKAILQLLVPLFADHTAAECFHAGMNLKRQSPILFCICRMQMVHPDWQLQRLVRKIGPLMAPMYQRRPREKTLARASTYDRTW